MKRLALLLLPVFAVLLMSHNVSATGVRLGAYIDFRSNNLVIGSDVSNGIEHNKDYTLTASGNNYIFIANGKFVVPSSYSFKSDTKYYLTIVQNFKSQVSGVNGSTFLSEPFDIYNDYAYTLSDDINSSRSCSSSSVCNFTFVHNIVLQGIGNGTADFNSIGNLFSTSGWTSSNSGSGVFNWTGFIFEDYDEWLTFRNSVVSELNGIHSDTTDIVDTLGEINDKLDKLDGNADKDAEAWDNMQNTDGLVDIGDDSQALSIVGSLNNVLGQVRDIPAATACSINANFAGRINLGDLNFCTGKETLGGVVAFSATVIFLFISFFIVLRIIKKVIRLISWCRKN